MQEGLRKLYTGQFNTMSQEHLADGTVTITLSSRGEDKVYRLRVKNLYQENEEVLEDEVIKVKAPAYIKKRVEEANQNA
jgi:hypothetical protein